jgi:hypothetical protein
MSYRLFIHPENQTILWNLIQKCPLWPEFSRVFPGKQEKWFRESMAELYDAIRAHPSSDADFSGKKEQWILQKNKDALQWMADRLRKLLGKEELSSSVSSVSSSSPELVYVHPSSRPSGVSSVSGSSLDFPPLQRNYDIPPLSAFDLEQERKAKQERGKQEFEKFQREYNTLLQPTTPFAPVFSEEKEEDKITMSEMDKLLKWQQEMRDRDIGLVGPPTATPGGGFERDSIKSEITELLSAKKEKKTVSWSETPGDLAESPPAVVFNL